MENRAILKVSPLDRTISVTVIPGHFATNHSHINYFVDLTNMKSMHKMAKAAAERFAQAYMGTPVETIVCLERTKMIAAFLADKLSSNGINDGQDVGVLTPELSNGQFLLRDNVKDFVFGKHVLVMFANVSTGLTAATAIEGIKYYGGTPVGIASLFSTVDQVGETPVTSIFSIDDLPDYETHSKANCPLCKNQVKLDALVNSYGYSKL